MNTTFRCRLASFRVSISVAVWVLSAWFTWTAAAQDVPGRIRRDPPTLSVTGRGETFATPDGATIRLGAIAEHSEAARAQAEVNERVQQVLKALRDRKVPENKIKTAGLSLSPVYHHPAQPATDSRRITGYRAYNTLQVEVDDLHRIGELIDAAVSAGATQVESVVFQLKNDLEPRRNALRLAAEEARAKADALASAMGLRIRGVREVIEGGVHLVQPRMELAQARLAFGAEQSTPVQPGEVQVEASVTVRYDVSDPSAPAF